MTKLMDRLELEGVTDVFKCSCSALTFTYDDKTYSCKQKNLHKYLPSKLWGLLKRMARTKSIHTVINCNHCVNHWGLDLCKCGSGNPHEKCNWGYRACKKPMQVFGEDDANNGPCWRRGNES